MRLPQGKGKGILRIEVLLLLMSVLTAYFVMYASSNSLEMTDHTAAMTIKALRAADDMGSLNLTGFTSSYHPPLPSLIRASALAVSGYNVKSLFIVNILFFWMLGLSVYGIGKKAAGESAGVLASSICLMYYSISNYVVKVIYDEFILAALVALAFYLLISSRMLKNDLERIGFFIVLALCSLTSISFIPFFVIAFPYVVFLGYKDTVDKRGYMIDVIRGSMLYSIISLPWYLLSLGFIFWRLATASADGGITGHLGSLISSSIIQMTLLDMLLGSLYLVLFSASLVIFLFRIIRGKADQHSILMLTWVVPPIFLFLFTTEMHVSHILPIVGGVAVFSAIQIERISSRIARVSIKAAVTGIAVVSLISLLVPFNIDLYYRSTNVKGRTYEYRMPEMPFLFTTYDSMPQAVPGRLIVDDIYDIVMIDSKSRNISVPKVAVYYHSLFFGYEHFMYRSLMPGRPKMNLTYTYYLGIDDLYGFDYIIASDFDSEFPHVIPMMGEFWNETISDRFIFDRIYQTIDCGGDKITLFRKDRAKEGPELAPILFSEETRPEVRI